MFDQIQAVHARHLDVTQKDIYLLSGKMIEDTQSILIDTAKLQAQSVPIDQFLDQSTYPQLIISYDYFHVLPSLFCCKMQKPVLKHTNGHI